MDICLNSMCFISFSIQFLAVSYCSLRNTVDSIDDDYGHTKFILEFIRKTELINGPVRSLVLRLLTFIFANFSKSHYQLVIYVEFYFDMIKLEIDFT